MAEIQVNDHIEKEVASLAKAASGSASPGSVSTSGVDTLKTCIAYGECCKAYFDLLTQYKQLVKKDAKEIDQFIRDMKTVDNS